MAVERATTSLIGTAISLIVLGFVVEKFELFLHLLAVELKGKSASKLPQLVHAQYYNDLGIFIVGAGIALALYTYRYYTRWVRHLEMGILDTDRKIYLVLSLFVASIGMLLLATMIIL
jgi:uncharacterized membrane protein YidH (DUF202 family)